MNIYHEKKMTNLIKLTNSTDSTESGDVSSLLKW